MLGKATSAVSQAASTAPRRTTRQAARFSTLEDWQIAGLRRSAGGIDHARTIEALARRADHFRRGYGGTPTLYAKAEARRLHHHFFSAPSQSKTTVSVDVTFSLTAIDTSTRCMSGVGLAYTAPFGSAKSRRGTDA